MAFFISMLLLKIHVSGAFRREFISCNYTFVKQGLRTGSPNGVFIRGSFGVGFPKDSERGHFELVALSDISFQVGHRGTMHDYPGFSPSVDAEAIRKAIRGIGTDEKTLISILTERTNSQRQLIAQEYQAAYGKELKDDLKGDLSGHLKQLMVALVTPPAVFDAKQLKKSMKGTGTSEHALIEILTTRTSRQMKEISQAYYTGGLILCLLLPLSTHVGAHVALPRNPPSSSSQGTLGRQDVKRRIHSKMGEGWWIFRGNVTVSRARNCCITTALTLCT
ncbi:annexin A6-like [Leptonychotes weddellii]|uniref:Annexin n=1 Tax=Leptonychotes weddellii TaxID=9713 RepID=A0A7F8Q276_LEPWE|nr:annexin A6-like [Leptonychotes weddellii]